MKIVLSKKEIKTIKEFILNAGDSLTVFNIGNSEETLDFVNHFEDRIIDRYDLKVFNVKFNLKGELVLNVSEDYMVEFMTIYSEFIVMAVPQVMALFKTLEVFFKKCITMNERYLELN